MGGNFMGVAAGGEPARGVTGRGYARTLHPLVHAAKCLVTFHVTYVTFHVT